jgi:hypothetical protein
MNAYTTKGQARIRQRDIENILYTDSYVASAALAAHERQRDSQADAELSWLLKQNGVTPNPVSSLVSLLRQTIGTALVRAGHRLEGVTGSDISSQAAPVAGTLGTAG